MAAAVTNLTRQWKRFETLEDAQDAATDYEIDYDDIVYSHDECSTYVFTRFRRSWQLKPITLAPKSNHSRILADVDTLICDMELNANSDHYGDRRAPEDPVVNEVKEKEASLMKKMFDCLNAEQKAEMKAEFKDVSFFKDRCTCCDKHTTNKSKCIHSDCPGMCSECHDNSIGENVRTCPACNRSQVLTCPVCLDEKQGNEMFKSDVCSHHVCYKCIVTGLQTNHPIESCPMCRANGFCDSIH